MKKDEPIWCKMYRNEVIKPKEKERVTERIGRTIESQSGFYASSNWVKMRDRRRLENPICQECEKKGRITHMQIVDHIIPIDERPDLALEFSNTQSLCSFHHVLKTNADKKRKNRLKHLESGQKIMKELERGGG